MTHDPNRTTQHEQTQPVEVQRYGPDPQRTAWHATPAWSSRASTPPPPVRVRRGLGALPIIAIAIVSGVVSGALSAVAVSNLMSDPTGQVGAPASDTPDANPVSDLRIDESSAVISAVDRVTPAVVTIQTTGGLGAASGTGSGFIFDASGFILTNRHVVADSQELVVMLNDGRQFAGTVYGIDTLTDLAIVTIEAQDLPAAPIGVSAGLEPGQLAIAIGNPLGYENTVTTGVVSGLGRQIVASDAAQTSAEQLNNLIQTDAAINPGNSGGPLVNSAGQVIGINTAVSTSEEGRGIGFAIPIDVAKPIMRQALNGQELVRPWIGVYYIPVTPVLAEEQDLGVAYGALIGTTGGDEAVFPGSPADMAGLQAGDMIVAINGEQITVDTDLSMLIIPHDPGDTITLRVLRDNAEREVEVTLGELP
ncbi:MAG: trypsin-like peptidase domain-containing protein [Candidatus Limnocylindria bacterium]